MLGAPCSAALESSSVPCRPHQKEGLVRSGHSSFYRIFLQENNSIHHFYCQTKDVHMRTSLVRCEIKARPCRCVITGMNWEPLLSSPDLICPARRQKCQHGTGLKGMLLVRSTAWPCAFTDSLLHGSLIFTMQCSKSQALPEPIKVV